MIGAPASPLLTLYLLSPLLRCQNRHLDSLMRRIIWAVFLRRSDPQWEETTFLLSVHSSWPSSPPGLWGATQHGSQGYPLLRLSITSKKKSTAVTDHPADWSLHHRSVMIKFLKWNCGGYYPNFEELDRLVALQTLKAVTFFLFINLFFIFLQSFIYRLPLVSQYRGANDRVGVVILLHDTVPFTRFPNPTRCLCPPRLPIYIMLCIPCS